MRVASRHLVDAALVAGASRYVQESVGFLYADGDDRWIDESAPVDAVRPTGTALDAEAEASRFASQGGTGVSLRFAEFVAGDSGHLRDLLPFLERGWLPLVGDPAGYPPYVEVDDAAAAEVLGRPVRLPPAIVGELPPLRARARSQRMSNGRLREVSDWSPRVPRVRDRWASLIPELRAARGS